MATLKSSIPAMCSSTSLPSASQRSSRNWKWVLVFTRCNLIELGIVPDVPESDDELTDFALLNDYARRLWGLRMSRASKRRRTSNDWCRQIAPVQLEQIEGAEMHVAAATAQPLKFSEGCCGAGRAVLAALEAGGTQVPLLSRAPEATWEYCLNLWLERHSKRHLVAHIERYG